jgi:uncharacterized protein (TIGR03437 family)
LVLNQTRYRLHAGEAMSIVAPREALDFMLRAKNRRVQLAGREGTGFVVGPSMKGDEVLLAASLRTQPGEYRVTLSAGNEVGEERTQTLDIVLDPMLPVPSNAKQPPVVLLNGWQFGLTSSCPVSNGPAGTFGNFAPYLDPISVPMVYFFDNCVEDPNGRIEDLGNALGAVLNLIRYDTGQLVPQVDLVAHSMGGLIIRAYLAGLQADGSLSPPPNPRVRKAILIATPNFGSFLASTAGTQTSEMVPASAFLWNLATWNQGSDDLRGVDTLAIVGNNGTWSASLVGPTWQNASDGVVSVTSASLSFARDGSRTRILPYCHIDSASAAGAFITCTGSGIAKAPETWNMVQSFLANTSAWATSGTAPPNNVSGVFVGVRNSTGQYVTDLTDVQFSGVGLVQNPQYELFYGDFLTPGQGTVQFTSSSLGNWQTTRTAFSGTFTPLRPKLGPTIGSVRPLRSSAAGLVVTSGGAITISGTGFGQSCASCGVFVAPQGSLQAFPLQVSSWSDPAITASLPANYSGLLQLIVRPATGQDFLNIMAATAQQPPAIGVSTQSLQFTFTIGGQNPAGQAIQVANTGGGSLSWSATAGAPWLNVSPASGIAPAVVTVAVGPSNLGAGTYKGTVQITAPNALNSPASVAVTLVVTAPSLTNLLAAGGSANVTPDSQVSAYAPPGVHLATTTLQAGDPPWPTSLGGTTVSVKDAAGTTRSAVISGIIPGQVNYVMPAGTTLGVATVAITAGDGSISSGPANVVKVAPGMVVLNGQNLIAANVLRVAADGTQAGEPIFQLDSTGRVVARPINLGSSAEQVFMVLYGTGFRAAGMASVTVMIGGVNVPVIYAGAQNQYPGFDQVNIGPLPRSLAGRGDVVIQVAAAGVAANAAHMTLQ